MFIINKSTTTGREARGGMVRGNCRGFTLAELITAMMITGIIMTAVVALSFAVGNASDTSHHTKETQAQVRFATVKLYELMSFSKLIVANSDTSIVIWKNDTNDSNAIDISEVVYIEAVDGSTALGLLTFQPPESLPTANPSDFQSSSCKDNLESTYPHEHTALLLNCYNITFSFDDPGVVITRRKMLNISFDLMEDGALRHYQISTKVGAWSGNLLSNDGLSIVTDDD